MNFEVIIIAVIAAVPPTVVAYAAVLSYRKTHDLVNSRMTELLEITRQLATSKATAAERKVGDARVADAKENYPDTPGP